MATFPHHYKSKLEKCEVRIDDAMYDVTGFRKVHPGGAELLDLYHNGDATDVFYAFHSKKAIAQLKHMKTRAINPKDPQRDKISLNFEALRQKLERNGWFERNWYAEFGLIMLPCLVLCIVGSLIATTYPVVASLMIGVGMQQAGWIGHDYGHGRGDACVRLNQIFGCVINGFSTRWWSHKHNTHHAFPNRYDVDSDIHNEPILHLWFPEKGKDMWYRRYQHHYYMIVYSFLYVSWRMQSIQFAISDGAKFELALMAIGYAWLLWLPLPVAIASLFIGGWLVAIVVTANHQPEPVLATTSKYNFVADQIVTTRGVVCPDPVSEYIFGGMQYQLEHHLFPFMPKYRYPAVRPLVKQFAEENGLEFKCSGIVDIFTRNYNVMKKFANTC